MLYKFKSQAAGDVIFLEASGRQVLAAMGKPADARGILLVADMAQALRLLEAAAVADEQARAQAKQAASAQPKALDPVSLRQRCQPLQKMIERSAAAEEPIVWGV